MSQSPWERIWNEGDFTVGIWTGDPPPYLGLPRA